MSFADAIETPLKVCQELDAILVGQYISFNLISIYRSGKPSNYKCITACVHCIHVYIAKVQTKNV